MTSIETRASLRAERYGTTHADAMLAHAKMAALKAEIEGDPAPPPLPAPHPETPPHR